MSISRDSFDHSDAPAIERLAAFAAVTATLFRVWPVGSVDDFNVTSVGHSVDQLVFSQVQLSPMRVLRDQTQLNLPGSDFLVLEQFLSGEEEIVMPLNNVRLTPGCINLRDWSVGFEGHADTHRTLRSIVIPRDRMPCAAEMGASQPILSWSLNSPAGQMLNLMWDQLLSDLDGASYRDVSDLLRALLGFVDALFSSGEMTPRSSETAEIQEFIGKNLHRSVGVSELCEVFDVSRSTIYERFKRFGGVEKYGLRRRLDRCYHDLCYANPAETKVGHVARAYGFDDPSVFNRRFRSQFGVAPSRMLGAWQKQIAAGLSETSHVQDETGSSYRDWFNGLRN